MSRYSPYRSLADNQGGYLHSGVYIAIIFLVVSSIGGAYLRSDKASSLPPKKPETPQLLSDTTTQTTAITVSVPPASTNQNEAKKPTTSLTTENTNLTSTRQKTVATNTINVRHDITKADGSLNQFLTDIYRLDFNQAQYFVTERFYSSLMSTLNMNGELTAADCYRNSFCNTLINTKIGIIKPAIENEYYDESGKKGKEYIFALTERDGVLVSQHPRYGGEFLVKIKMISAGTHWKIESVTINNYTI